MDKGSADRLALGVAEVADALGIGQTLARQLIRSGDIKSFRLGNPSRGLIRVRREELDRFVESREAAATR